MRAAAVVLGTRPLVVDTVSSLVSGNITGEGGALSMLELAGGTSCTVRKNRKLCLFVSSAA